MTPKERKKKNYKDKSHPPSITLKRQINFHIRKRDFKQIYHEQEGYLRKIQVAGVKISRA